MKVGSERTFASSDNSAKIRLDRNRDFSLSKPPAGTLRNWRCYKRIHSQKDPYRHARFDPPESWYCYGRIHSLVTRRKVKALSKSFMKEGPPWRCYRRIYRSWPPKHPWSSPPDNRIAARHFPTLPAAPESLKIDENR